MSGPPVILSSRRNVFRRREASRVATCTLLPTCKNKRSQKAKVSKYSQKYSSFEVENPYLTDYRFYSTEFPLSKYSPISHATIKSWYVTCKYVGTIVSRKDKKYHIKTTENILYNVK